MILTHGSNSISRVTQTYVTIGGRQYKTVTIGNQLWLAVNLDYKFQVDGSQLPIGVSGTPSTPSAWYYNNDEATYGVDGNRYGLLYNWYAAKYLEDNKSTLLPEGWHVPTNDEITQLFNSAGGISNCGYNLRSVDGWNAPSYSGIDIYGFNGVPSGCMYSPWGSNEIKFRYVGDYFEIHSITYIDGNPCSFYTYGPFGYEFRMNNFDSISRYGYSIRLVKDVT